MKMRGFIIFFIAFLLASVCSSQEQKSALPDDDLNLILDDAIAAASVYNWERAEKLCDCIISVLYDTQLKARAHWVKAVAYARFHLEYRTRDLEDKLKREIELIRELQPSLLEEVLPRYDITLKIYLEDNIDWDKFLKSMENESGGKNPKDALDTYKLGQAYYAAGLDAGNKSKEKQKEYYEKATAYFQKSHEAREQNYEFAAYYLTLLTYTGNLEEAEAVARKMTEQSPTVPRYSFERDPWYYLAQVVMISDREKGLKILEGRARQPEADAWVHYELVLNKTKNAASELEKSQLLGEFIRKMEEGELNQNGANLHALASAYYKLAHSQFQQGLAEEALATYRKLAALSPHYAEIHYNQGVIFKSLSDKESNPERKRNLIERVKKEMELQMQYNWGGRAAENARKFLQNSFK